MKDQDLLLHKKICRKYTFTIKPSYNQYKGNLERLLKNFLEYLGRINTLQYQFSIEYEGTDNVHIHALIECPIIKDKARAAHYAFGYHVQANLIRTKDEDNIVALYKLYMLKEKSDSERIYSVYGNLFE